MCGHGERAMTGASVLERAGQRRPRGPRRRPGGLGRCHRTRARDRPMTQHDAPETHPVRLGLRENLGQFVLLVAINALVGGMIGQERTVLPLLAEEGLRAHRVHGRAHLHRGLRRGEGGHQLLRRDALGSGRSQAGARRRLV